jgi:hypothetical protein
MQQIEATAAKLGAARDALTEAHMAEEREKSAITKEHLPAIRKLTREFKAAAETLQALVAESQALFEKPKSRVLHAIALGFRKGSGKISFEDEDQVIKLMRKHLSADQVELLVVQTESVSKEALATLDVATLKKLGCTVEDTDDVPFVRLAEKESAKLIKALLKQSAAEEAGA